MGGTISLANKYRPKAFSEVCEQDSVRIILENQIKTNNLKHAYLFCGGAGTGKAQPLDSKILTPLGYTKMGDIKVGDTVIDGLGNITTVTEIFPQGLKPVYRVTFSDRTSVLCSDEHLWKVGEYKHSGNKHFIKWSVKSINELVRGGIRKNFSSTESRLRYRIPTPIITCWKDNDITIDPYVLGVLLGDGVLHTAGIKIANTEQDIINKVETKLNNMGYTLHKVNQSDTSRCDIYSIVQQDLKNSNQYTEKSGFRKYVEQLNLCKKSIDKFIPTNYLYASVETRLELLQGLFDTDGWVDNRRARSVLQYSTSSRQLSDDFAFLVRSLGGTDTVVRRTAGYKADNGDYVKCNDSYEHTIKFSTDILPFSSKKHSSKYAKPQNYAQRKIMNIEYVGEQECQCIMVSSDDHTYITDNVTVTHNTTTARIIANMMNEGKSKPIELDCASHNGVDDMRIIQDECKTRPLSGRYKIFVLDECMTPDTEILTDQGYKRFIDLDHTEKIAQYTDDGYIEFVTPKRWIKQHYEGYLECWQPRKGHTIKMTPHHQQPLLYNKSNQVISKSICDVKLAQSNSLILAGRGVGNKDVLSYIDILAIICQADGCIQYERDTYNRWLVSFKKPRKIERFLDIIQKCNIEYTEVHTNRVGVRKFTFSTPKTITKMLNTHFRLDFSYECAREFINEIKNWDGYIGKGYLYYSSTIKENVDFVSAVATLGGYCAKQTKFVDNRSDKYNDIYRLFLYDKITRSCQHLQKYRTQEYYNGDVYCVEVPSHKIVVRASGYTIITGNCHMLTVQAWNSLLKILEEPPEYVIFLFCTTDPQKILPTILSRVQRFNFARISLDGIKNRLIYILQQEGISTYEFEAIEYIARLARGGMRDAITTLEKCLDYDKNLTLTNVLQATSGGITETTLFDLLRYILNGDCANALIYFNKIYMSGVDVSLFLRLFIEYIQNCVKYLITKSADITTLSNNSIQWLNQIPNFTPQLRLLLISILNIRTNVSSEDLKILIESWIIEKCNL